MATAEPALIAIVGPTGVGKTAVAVELCRRIPAEIVNADSMQVYAGMVVGSAAPTPATLGGIPAHLVGYVEPTADYSVARWRSDAEAAILSIAARGRPAVVCGGTGMYIRALLRGWTLAHTPPDAALRERLYAEAGQKGNTELHDRLSTVNPERARQLHPNDTVRIIRALEIAAAGQSGGVGAGCGIVQEHDTVVIGLRGSSTWLRERIVARVRAMLDAGLEAEVRGLLAAGLPRDAKPLRALNYRQMVAVIDGRTTLDEAETDMSRATWQYARRQMTWFRSDEQIEWIDVDGLSACDVADKITDRMTAARPEPVARRDGAQVRAVGSSSP